MRIVVTGATGNVGSATLRALAADDRVEAIVGLARRQPTEAWAKVTWQAADVARDPLEPLLAGADAVIHLAWLIQPSRDESVTRAVNVDGTQRVLDAAAAAHVPRVVVASSIGAYSPGPKDRPVDETWPTGGIPSSFYARHKAEVERRLDGFEHAHPDIRVVRLRPGLIFQRSAASEIRRLFAGPLLPNALLRPKLIPALPFPRGMAVQAVHSDDVADAYRRAALDPDAAGAYNIAADPVLDADCVGRILGARVIEVPPKALRAAADLSWRARLQPTSPGWLDMGMAVPIMDTTRAREQLGWTPTRNAADTLLELLDGMVHGQGGPTPPLERHAGGRARLGELRTGVGGRA
jgi:nucleoside-diphosphate-sugar epimerase